MNMLPHQVTTAFWLMVSLSTVTALSSPDVLYTLSRHACEASLVENTAIAESSVEQRLLRNLNSTSCDKSMGLRQDSQRYEGPVLQSQGQTREILQTIKSKAGGVSFELWFEPNDVKSSAHKRPIMTFGHTKKAIDQPLVGLTTCDREGFDFQLSQRGGHLQVEYRTSDLFVEPCQILRLSDLPLLREGALAHVVVSLSDRHQQVVLNGQPSHALRETFSNNLKHWHDDWTMTLMGYHSPVPAAWEGIIYQLAVFSEALSTEKARKLIVQGLPPAEPYSVNGHFDVNEDAEDVAGSHEVSWYRKEAPLEDAGGIHLQYRSLNTEVEAFQRDLNLDSSVPLPPVFYYITTLPALGHLAQLDGRKMDGHDLEVTGVAPVGSSDGELVYIPPLHSYSEHLGAPEGFTQFTYCVSSGPIMNAEQCQSSSVTIDVKAVNDPPVATPVHAVVQQEGKDTLALPKILLTGTDVDIGDSIKAVQITRPPVYGNLQLSVGQFRQDRLPHGTPVAELDYTIPSADPVYVNYIWRSDGKGPIVQGQATRDSFSFRVQDSAGAWSLEESVEIGLRSALKAVGNPVSVIQEDTPTEGNVHLHGEDLSGYKRRLGVYVEAVPSSKGGILVDSVSGDIVPSKMLLRETGISPFDTGTALTFIPKEDYCSRYGNVTDDLTLSYRIVAFASKDDDTIVSSSDAMEQGIHVDCSIDVLSLTSPAEPFVVKETTLRKSGGDPCRGLKLNFTTEVASNCDVVALVNGITVTSRDRRTEKALVTVLPGQGYVTFNENGWIHAQVLKGRRSMVSKNVTFHAFPEDLNAVFQDLQFQSYRPGIHSIDIIIRYGNCSWIQEDDLEDGFHVSSSSSCQILRTSIPIEVLVDATKYKAEKRLGGDEFPWSVLVSLLGFSTLYYAFVSLELFLEGPDDDTVCTQEELPLWIQHRTEEGDFYYENTETGITTWMAPVGEDFLAWKEEECYEEEEEN